ncbi:hypothetical protein PsYK624_007160 [Phanerochaete sordida]|uniref:Uncharacterized protein n=1 Tax=Phanerochaete sordida TaxID=48140 RepID=A0A9P3L781_9APHY|nr:hypothetical protein PsYK624_007160 [Phanerochaete sordida]
MMPPQLSAVGSSRLAANRVTEPCVQNVQLRERDPAEPRALQRWPDLQHAVSAYVVPGVLLKPHVCQGRRRPRRRTQRQEHANLTFGSQVPPSRQPRCRVRTQQQLVRP